MMVLTRDLLTEAVNETLQVILPVMEWLVRLFKLTLARN